MKKKSIYDIAMEQKANTKDDNIIITKRSSKVSVIFEIIEKILKLIFYIIICLLLTVGTTVLVNSELRNNLLEIIKINV